MRSAEAGPDSRGGEEDRNEARFEKHAVRLVAGEVLGGDDERKETHKANEECEARPEIEGDEYGRGHPCPADGEQHVRAARQPQERRRIPYAAEKPERLLYLPQVGARGQYSAWTDQAADLED